MTVHLAQGASLYALLKPPPSHPPAPSIGIRRCMASARSIPVGRHPPPGSVRPSDGPIGHDEPPVPVDRPDPLRGTRPARTGHRPRPPGRLACPARSSPAQRRVPAARRLCGRASSSPARVEAHARTPSAPGGLVIPESVHRSSARHEPPETWRCDAPASKASSSWLTRRRSRQCLRAAPNAPLAASGTA